MTVGILALAAGQSARFGSDKRAAKLADGRSVMDTFLATLTTTQLPYLVCLRAADHEWAAHLSARNVDFYQCGTAGEGMGSTLAEGISQVDGWSGALVALADMPWIQAGTFLFLAEQISPGTIVVPTYDGRRGNPVGFSNTFFDELKNLHGDKGARRLLTIHAKSVSELKVSDRYIHEDIDTPDRLTDSSDS